MSDIKIELPDDLETVFDATKHVFTASFGGYYSVSAGIDGPSYTVKVEAGQTLFDAAKKQGGIPDEHLAMIEKFGSFPITEKVEMTDKTEWRTVPVEPVDCQISAAMHVNPDLFIGDIVELYDALINAAPTPPKSAYHAPGLGEVHSEDHTQMVFCETNGIVDDKMAAFVCDLLNNTPPKSEPAKYEFQDRDGTWHPFIDDRHFKKTVEDGSWPIRALYTEPQGPCDRNAVIEECAKVCDELERNGYVYETYDGFDEIPAEACHCAAAIRALKSQPAAPDKRDEALRLAKKAMLSGAYDQATEALAAIEDAQKGGA